MLRISLFAVAALMAAALLGDVVHAQVAGDADAAAPVVYTDASATAPGCDSDVRNADGSPVISCVADPQAQDDEYADAETGEYPQDYVYDEAPDYDTSAYYASDYVRPNFYLGISPLPYDYWSFGFGWPYYSYAAFGYGWPYFGFASYWGGRHWGGHHGWHDHHGGGHDHHGHDGGYHGPYRYAGHGRYWDQTHASNSNRGGHGDHGNGNGHGTGAALNTSASAMNRSNAMGNRIPAAAANASRFAPSANNRAIGGAGQRAVLPSASYYAAARSGMRTAPASMARSVPMSRNNMVNTHAPNQHAANQAYRVTSLPSRNYAAYARANSVYRNNSGSAARSGGYAPQRGYAMAPRAAYSAQRYAMPSRGYSAPRSMPSYSRGGGGHAMRSGGVSTAHSSGASHASNGATRRH
jgi:hypothetical protein